MRSPSPRIFAAILLLCLFGQSSVAAAKPKRPPPAAKKTTAKKEKPSSGGGAGSTLSESDLALIGKTAPPWSWRQILASPRIGGRLTAVTVDRRDPRRIYVGTEEGALISTIDGGITWDERQLSPSVIQARSFVSKGVDAPDPGDAESAKISAGKDPPNRFYADDLGLPFIGELVWGDSSPFPSLGFPLDIWSEPADATLLSDAVTSHAEEVVPVKRIVLCPGGRFPLLVATTREVYGSTDDGITTLRLFFITGNVPIEQIACSPWNPNDIAVASEKGVFRSKDGGLSFAEVLTAAPGLPATAVSYALDPEKNLPVLYAATDGSIYRGDPDSPSGLEYIYPPDDDSESAPWADVRKIDVTRSGEVWLATDDGVRYSRDGKSWLNIEPRLFGDRPVLDVKVDSEERIGVLMKDYLYVSDDDGATWQPYFYGITRRSFRGLAWAPRPDGNGTAWWVVTNGELWSSAPPPVSKTSVDVEAERWARAALAASPSLSETLSRALEETGLSAERIEELAHRDRARIWVPLLDVKLTAASEPFARTLSLTPLMLTTNERTDRTEVEVMVQLTWPFFEDKILVEEAGSVRESLYELRKQVSFAAEDAWHERDMHLKRLAEGIADPVQVAVTKARIEALEALLDQWAWRRSK